MEGPFTKVCVRVDSEEELLAVVERVRDASVHVQLCVDAGRTEFNGVPTPTSGGDIRLIALITEPGPVGAQFTPRSCTTRLTRPPLAPSDRE